jgi:hypothetical protein
VTHLRSIEEKCRTCGGRASVELLNRFNSRMGYYCKRDGAAALKRLQADEAH